MSQKSVVPVTGSRLRGRRRGQSLTVTGMHDEPVVAATLGKTAQEDASFETADGEYRVVATALWQGGSDAAVVDRAGERVAIARHGEVSLPSEETLVWKRTWSLGRRYRLGEDLWVARSRGIRAGFSAALSPAILARPDTNLLVGIASILTYYAIDRDRRTDTAAADVASWG